MKKGVKKKGKGAPIKHWSHSSLSAFLRNPLAWYKRYVEEVYDLPANPSSVVGRAGHVALEHFYSGVPKEIAVKKGLEHLRGVADFELNFGKLTSLRAKKARRKAMEEEYLRAIGYYLAKPPKHAVLGVEVVGVVEVAGLPLPLKAISDLVVESKVEKGAVDIVDHKFVASFSKNGAEKSLFMLQAMFNYYTVRELFQRPVRRFMVYECKKTRNADGRSQLRRYVIDYAECAEDFAVFNRLICDATAEIMRERRYLPNPSDLFDGDHSFLLYRLDLLE